MQMSFDHPRRVRVAAVAVALTLVWSSDVALAPAADAAGWKPKVQQTASVSVKEQRFGRAKVPTADHYTPDAAVWPAATDTRVDLRNAKAGKPIRAESSPVLVGVPEKASGWRADAVRVRVLDRVASDELVGVGVVTAIESPMDADATVGIDYSSFADAMGAGFGGRLKLVSLPGADRCGVHQRWSQRATDSHGARYGIRRDRAIAISEWPTISVCHGLAVPFGIGVPVYPVPFGIGISIDIGVAGRLPVAEQVFGSFGGDSPAVGKRRRNGCDGSGGGGCHLQRAG